MYSKKIAGPAERRGVVKYAIVAHSIGIKRACGILGLARSAYYRKPRHKKDSELKLLLLQLAKQHIRWGFTKMYRFIKKQGYSWNHKRVRRVYCELRLNLRKKPKKGYQQEKRSLCYSRYKVTIVGQWTL